MSNLQQLRRYLRVKQPHTSDTRSKPEQRAPGCRTRLSRVGLEQHQAVAGSGFLSPSWGSLRSVPVAGNLSLAFGCPGACGEPSMELASP